jgi:predicted CXXCH cytochrome family protein
MRALSSKLLLALPLVALLASCTTEKIVFRDRDPFNEPVAAARGFLGYYSAETKRTTCGNCHVDFQTKWAGSAHAGAWADLPADAQDFCKSCHSVNELGNMLTEAGGWNATQDPIYYDVQCESCHGPGLEHVRAVNQGQIVRPLAKLGMTGEGTCGDCHSGAHHPYAEEWALSNHAKPGTRASNTTCAPCHEGRGALASWGMTNNFVEKSDPTAYVSVATCATCHDPHGTDNPAQLRFPIDSPDPATNLCMKCHLRRDAPAVSGYGSTAPHAPQGSVLLGIAGYRPAGFVYEEERIFGSHASDRNPRLCAGCHIAKFTVTDPQGGFVQEATGHLMRPIPCLDAEGKPTADKTCAYTATARSWATCTNSGCHANASAAAAAFNSRRDLMALLSGQLWTDLNGNGQLQAAPTDGGLLAQVRQLYPGEWSDTDNRVSPAEGAEFNARLCGEYGSSNSDNSKGAHNPFLCVALLSASINEITATYALPAPPAEIQAVIDRALDLANPSGMQRSTVKIAGAQQ